MSRIKSKTVFRFIKSKSKKKRIYRQLGASSTSTLTVGDYVIVTQGEYKGFLGKITQIDSDVFTLTLLYDNLKKKFNETITINNSNVEFKNIIPKEDTYVILQKFNFTINADTLSDTASSITSTNNGFIQSLDTKVNTLDKTHAKNALILYKYNDKVILIIDILEKTNIQYLELGDLADFDKKGQITLLGDSIKDIKIIDNLGIEYFNRHEVEIYKQIDSNTHGSNTRGSNTPVELKIAEKCKSRICYTKGPYYLDFKLEFKNNWLEYEEDNDDNEDKLMNYFKEQLCKLTFDNSESEKLSSNNTDVNNKITINNILFKIVNTTYDNTNEKYFKILKQNLGIFILTLLCLKKIHITKCRYINIFALIRKLNKREIYIDDYDKLLSMYKYIYYIHNVTKESIKSLCVSESDIQTNIGNTSVSNWIKNDIQKIYNAIKLKQIYIKLE